MLTLDSWTLDRGSRRLLQDGRAAVLGDRAFDLLCVLAQAPGEVVDAATLLQRAWPGRVVEENNLHVQVLALRKLLGPQAIRTVRGRGYQLTLDVRSNGSAAGLQQPAPAPLPTPLPASLPGNLPRQLPLIGRETELAALLALMQRHAAVTLTGPGGVGKTRLALAAAQARVRQHPEAGGAWLVELAGVAAGAPVAEAVACALGLSLPGLQAPDDELLDLLRNRSLLLLLDNCEHRADEAGRLLALLGRGAAGVQVLATSQVRLAHAREQVFRLGPLALPDPQASPAEARAAGAVALFCAREAAHNGGQPSGTEGDEALAAVVAICQKLDGLPLALELAAARVPLLGLAGLRDRLGQQLRLLGHGPRNAPVRHQTLHAAIDWSHSLLAADERQAFRWLGVMASSFTVALALRLLADGAAGDEGEAAALDLLHTLLDKSLLAALPGAPGTAGAAEPRLRMLESTRSFAQAMLMATGEWEAAQVRLARALLQQFARGEGEAAFEVTLDKLRTRALDLDSVRGTLDALATMPAQAALHIELAVATSWLWSRLGLRPEGLRRCRQALDRVDAATPPQLEARLQLAWATLAYRRGAPGDEAAAARAAALFQAQGDRLGCFRAQSVLCLCLALAGDEARCGPALERLAEVFDPGWNQLQWAVYYHNMGYCLAQLERDAEMVAMAEAGGRQVRHLREDEPLSAYHTVAAQVAAVLGDPGLAVQRGEQAVAAARRARSPTRLGVALGDLATYLVDAGRVPEALPLAREAAALRAVDGSLGLQLDQLAWLACARGRYREAALARGRADLHHSGRAGRRERYLRGPHQRTGAALAAALDADELAACLRQGALLGDDEVAQLTLGEG